MTFNMDGLIQELLGFPYPWKVSAQAQPVLHLATLLDQQAQGLENAQRIAAEGNGNPSMDQARARNAEHVQALRNQSTELKIYAALLLVIAAILIVAIVYFTELLLQNIVTILVSPVAGAIEAAGIRAAAGGTRDRIVRYIKEMTEKVGKKKTSGQMNIFGNSKSKGGRGNNGRGNNGRGNEKPLTDKEKRAVARAKNEAGKRQINIELNLRSWDHWVDQLGKAMPGSAEEARALQEMANIRTRLHGLGYNG